MKGIILRNGNKISVKGKTIEEIFKEDNCVVFLDIDRREVFLWKGSNSVTKDRFSAAHLANSLDEREFGGAGSIIQTENVIKKSVASSDIKNIPKRKIRGI